VSASLEPLGPIVRLQVQVGHLKTGSPRRYDPAPITSVDRLVVDADGVTGYTSDGVALLDVHNRMHPLSRFRGDNGISIGFTGHYRAMRIRFGDGPDDGAAGENLLVDDARVHEEARLVRGVIVESADGPVRLTTVTGAPPCAEFTRYCLGVPAGEPDRRAVAAGLEFLGHGMRGFYAQIEAGTAAIRHGAMVYAIS
jgi:hypothetical protein